MPDVFLSYSREDQATARRFAEGLGREGFSVWWDQTLTAGEAFDEVTEKALAEARAVVVLWSPRAVASRWVRAEAAQADENGTLVPVLIEPCTIPIKFKLTQTADLSSWKGNADDAQWRAFLAGLQRLTSPGVPDRAPSAAVPPSRGITSARPILAGVAVLLVLVLGLGAWWLAGRKDVQQPAPAAGSGSPAQTAALTLAVMPFTNLSADPAQAYLSDVLPEELAIQLNQVRALRAKGPESTRRYRDSDADPRAIATELGVANILTGTVRRDEHQWRFTAKLIDGTDGTPRWTKAYQGELQGLFALQEEMVKDVAQAVGVVLGVSDYPRVIGGTENVEAYEQYMHARSMWRSGSPYPEMLPFLREAVRLDPEYRRAWMTLHASLRNVIGFAPGGTLAGLRRERQAAAAKLEELPPDSRLALRYRSNTSLERHDWKAAIAAAEAGVAAAPASDFDSSYVLALALWSVGRISDAIPHLRRSVEAEPLHQEPSAILQVALRVVGREAEAQEEAARAASRGVPPVESPFGLSQAEALKILGRPRPDGRLDFPFAGERPEILQDRPAALAVLRRNLDGPNASDQPELVLVATFALGDADLARSLTERRISERPEATLGMLLGVWSSPPDWRRSPSFKGLMQDLVLADYWRSTGNWGDFCKPVGEDDFECS